MSCGDLENKAVPLDPALATASHGTTAGTVVVTRLLRDDDLSTVAPLHAVVFGPGRFARTAYRVREGTPLVSPFCRGAFLDGALIASLRMTHVTIGSTGPHLLLGPLAVSPPYAGQGYGKRLVSEALDAGRAAGIGVVALVGDLSYYQRFGFSVATPGKLVLPGPVDPGRILVCELTPGALATAAGLIRGVSLA